MNIRCCCVVQRCMDQSRSYVVSTMDRVIDCIQFERSVTTCDLCLAELMYFRMMCWMFSARTLTNSVWITLLNSEVTTLRPLCGRPIVLGGRCDDESALL